MKNVGRRLRIPSSTSSRMDSGFSPRLRQSSAPLQRIRVHPTSRTSSQFFRTRSGSLRLRTSPSSRSSNVRFGRVVNHESQSRPIHTATSHVPRRVATSSNTQSSRMVSIPKSLLLSLLQKARRLGRNSNVRKIEQAAPPQPVTQPTVHLTLQGNGLVNSISNTIGSQLQNLLNWNRVQNVLDTTAQQRLPSIPSSLAFNPLIEEPFGNDPQYLILPSMSPPVLFATQPAPKYKPTQFDLELQAHILDELGFEHLIKDTPDASDVKQETKAEKKAPEKKKTKIVINTKSQNNPKSNVQNAQSQPHTNNNNNNNSQKNNQNNNNQGLQHVVAQPVSTTMEPIRIVLNNFQQTMNVNRPTTQVPGPISVNHNQKLIITPSGNYTIQQIPLSNSGFQIA